MRPQPLLERVPADECRELAHQLLVVARAQVGGDALVQRSEARRVQAGRLGDGEGRAPHVGQGITPPQGEAGGERDGGGGGAAGFDGGPALPAVLLEAVGVQLDGLQAVAAVLEGQSRRRSEHLAGPGDDHPQRGDGMGWQLLAPEVVDELVGGDRTTVGQGQTGHERPTRRPEAVAFRRVRIVHADQDRPKDVDAQHHPERTDGGPDQIPAMRRPRRTSHGP